MLIEAADASRRYGSSAAAFWWRFTDNAFRRMGWFLLPILIFTGLGIVQANQTLALYKTTGVLSARSNPLLPDQPVASTSALNWETAAEATSRTMNEQLRTDSFIEDVAGRAGLTDDIESGAVRLDVIRESVWTSQEGSSLVKVNGTWADPQVSFALVEGTIAAYQQFLADIVASASSEAEAFYATQLDDFQAQADAAQVKLDDFVSKLTPTELDNPPLTVQMEIGRLSDALSAAEDKVTSVENDLETAQLAVAQSRSEAGRSLTVIDAPKLPDAPESTLVKRALAVISFMLLGAVVSLGALLVTTVLDQSVASVPDVLSVSGVTAVAVVPRTKRRRASDWRRRRRRRTENAPRPHSEQQPVGT